MQGGALYDQDDMWGEAGYVSTYVFCDMVDVVVKIEDFIIQSCCVGMFMSCMETSILKYVRL